MAEASPTEIRAHIDPHSHERSHWKAWSLFLLVFSVYAASLFGAIYSAQLPILPSWMWKSLLVFTNGGAIAVLFIIGHDGCHRCYSPSRIADGFIGRACFLPCLWSFSTWRVVHNYFHHGYTNIKDKDTSWPPMSLEEFENASWLEQKIERHIRTRLGIATHWLYSVWWRRGVFPQPCDWQLINKRKFEYIWETALIIAFAIAEVAMVVKLGAHEFSALGPLASVAAVFVYLGIPFWLYGFWTGLITLVQHTHPTTVWFANQNEWTFFDSQIDGTVHFKPPPIIALFFIDVMEHNAHHVDTMIPLYNLIGPQSSLERAYPDNIIVEEFSFGSVRNILNTCQLYDFENHCWLDFDGNRTTEPVTLVPKTTLAGPHFQHAAHDVSERV